MSTKNIEAVFKRFAEVAPDGFGDGLMIEKARTELEDIRKARRLLFVQLGALREHCARRAVVDPETVLEAVGRMERILGAEESS